MNNNQRMAFAVEAEEQERRIRKKSNKGKREGKKKMPPASRKGKNRFKY